MSRKPARSPRAGASPGCTVTVCRGCCCGSAAKHPDVDHGAQLAELRERLKGVAQVRVSSCLDTCERSNVVVVTPSDAGRAAGARPAWLGDVLAEDATEEIVEWVRAGGPGVSDPPLAVDLRLFSPSRRVRAVVGE